MSRVVNDLGVNGGDGEFLSNIGAIVKAIEESGGGGVG